MYCSKCKITKGPFIKYKGPSPSQPRSLQYYYCNPCNTNRARMYRQTNNGKTNTYKATKKYTKSHKERSSAWSAVHWHIKVKGVCIVCGNPKVDGHHPNPLKKLQVIWLCRFHHKQVHKEYNYLHKYYINS